MPPVDIIEPDLFVLNSLTPEDIGVVMAFAYQVAEQVGECVYVAAFGVDGRRVGGPPLEGPPDGAVVRLGREDAAQIGWFGTGRDIVLWQPPSQQWAAELMGHHWWRQRQLSWGVLVDGREMEEAVTSIQHAWPRRCKAGDDLGRLRSSVGRDRKVAMLSHDGSFFSGKASPDCWELVRRLLEEISGGDIEVYEAEGGK